MDTDIDPQQDELPRPATSASEAVLTEAVRHVDIVHTSLFGMAAIVVVLLGAVALPVFGLPPVAHVAPFIIITVVSFIGIGYLYFLNYRVHTHVTNQARLTEVLVNSLGQGFLVFGKDGICEPVYSQACIDLLEVIPEGHNIADVLHIPEESRGDFADWLNVLFQPDHALGFDEVVKFLPSLAPHSQKRRVSLVYRPIRRKDGTLVSVVVIATDQTEEYAAREQARQQQIFAERVYRIFKERNQFHATLTMLNDFLEAAKTPTLGAHDAAPMQRQLHTLKATLKHFNLFDLAEVIHSVEGDLRSAIGSDDATFHRFLSAGRERIAEAQARAIDEVRDLIGTDNKAWRGNVIEVNESEVYQFAEDMQRRGAEPDLIRRYLIAIASVPVRDCFSPFQRELQELSSMMDKPVKPIRFVGDNPRVLTRPMQAFLFSLTHICRNIMDHGIETSVTRMARGKDPVGEVTIDTSVVGGEGGKEWLRIVIADDGNGIDPQRIRSRLATFDPEGHWRFEDDQAIIQRIFSWGFSTRDEVTMISGRGVGLEVVEREVKLLGGTIRVTSELYKGTQFEIRLPHGYEFGAGADQIAGPVDRKSA